MLVLAEADYPFLNILWTMIIFFAWVAWIWVVISILSDIFRRHDIGGWHKAIWVLFVIILPFVGVLIYLIAEHDGMQERTMAQAKAQQQAFDSYVQERAGGSAAEIAKAAELLDAGKISQAEFDALKAKALA
jgi:ABC-type transport system involved in cytochrome bd biosynthesis fused ATPase/permease subunit